MLIYNINNMFDNYNYPPIEDISVSNTDFWTYLDYYCTHHDFEAWSSVIKYGRLQKNNIEELVKSMIISLNCIITRRYDERIKKNLCTIFKNINFSENFIDTNIDKLPIESYYDIIMYQRYISLNTFKKIITKDDEFNKLTTDINSYFYKGNSLSELILRTYPIKFLIKNANYDEKFSNQFYIDFYDKVNWKKVPNNIYKILTYDNINKFITFIDMNLLINVLLTDKNYELVTKIINNNDLFDHIKINQEVLYQLIKSITLNCDQLKEIINYDVSLVGLICEYQSHFTDVGNFIDKDIFVNADLIYTQKFVDIILKNKKLYKHINWTILSRKFNNKIIKKEFTNWLKNNNIRIKFGEYSSENIEDNNYIIIEPPGLNSNIYSATPIKNLDKLTTYGSNLFCGANPFAEFSLCKINDKYQLKLINDSYMNDNCDVYNDIEIVKKKIEQYLCTNKSKYCTHI